MKKPKIKPEVVWMPWHECYGFVVSDWSHSKKGCMVNFMRNQQPTWPQLRKDGWRIVKVRISECKK